MERIDVDNGILLLVGEVMKGEGVTIIILLNRGKDDIFIVYINDLTLFVTIARGEEGEKTGALVEDECFSFDIILGCDSE